MIPNYSEFAAAAASLGVKPLRRLRANELVGHGDFIRNEQQEFEPWVGPGGFRADSFLKPIYRQQRVRSVRVKK